MPLLTARQDEIQRILTFLNEGKAVVSLHGGPGFGKTAIAVEASHKLRKDHSIPVVFSQLTSASTAEDVICQLCYDLDLYNKDDPKSSLTLWLKNLDSKVVFVMDDIDSLLERKTSFYEFVHFLRKNSSQHCQIVTTSRTSYEIPELFIGKVQVDEMEDEACVELMRKHCPEQEDEFLERLATLCGKIPLSMCIAVSRVADFEDREELLQRLRRQPVKFLECPERDQYIYRAISMSYEKCSDEEKESFVRLSVFDGSFSEDAARVVIGKINTNTSDILEKLVGHSLIKQPSKQRYSVHLLIKHFLQEQENGEDETAQRAREEMMRAQLLMVEYFLNLGHEVTMGSYSKDGYKENRETLKQEAHNIQKVLKICCQPENRRTSNISDCLTQSEIYTTSARFFSIFVRTIIPGSLVDEFLQRCANLAKDRRQHAININFDCLLAEQERSKSIGKSCERFIDMFEKIKNEFETHYEEIKEDTSLCAHYYNLYGRYLSYKSDKLFREERLNLQVEARKQLEKSLKLRETLADTSLGKADKVLSLLHLGNKCKLISQSQNILGKRNESTSSLKQARNYYYDARHLSETQLGEHELTASCYKCLGDTFFIDSPKMAEQFYAPAKKMRENLGLHFSQRHALLLNNFGRCLTQINRADGAIALLETARNMAEKLYESDEPNQCKVKIYSSLALAYNSTHNYPKALEYARKALEMDIERVIRKKDRERLREIIYRNNSQ